MDSPNRENMGPILRTIPFITAAWDEIDPLVIKNCFRKAAFGFSDETDTTDSTPTETEEILQNFRDYATVDDALVISNTRTIDDMIAIAMREKKVTLKKRTIIPQHLQFLLACRTWASSEKDTAGQERFRTITTAYYRGAMGIMLVYDITNEKSFENIKNWIRNIEENASADVEKMLLGNKCELEEKRQVSKERGEQLAIEYGIKFIETSAKASIRVEDAFFTLARDIKAKMEKKLEFCPGHGSSSVVSRPFLNRLNRLKTCVRDKHSFPYTSFPYINIA
ncbi:hypothetical protein NQ318_014414 [Aromia moschata]|uniref:Uncharacterized protein n=1 Tax=Aromia moschata TaxID=1265417 RepID=A0AAV8Y6J1_9CUCU|nr:hypothetical protein NQ318_014414 [Aromia moschata]